MESNLSARSEIPLRIIRILLLLLFIACALVFGGMLVTYLPMLALRSEGAFLVEPESPVRSYLVLPADTGVLRIQGAYLFAAALPYLISMAMELVLLLWLYLLLRRLGKRETFFTGGGCKSLVALSVWSVLAVAAPWVASHFAADFVKAGGAVELAPWRFAVPLGVSVSVVGFTVVYIILFRRKSAAEA